MSTSKTIAQLAGPVLVLLTASEVRNLHIWANNLPSLTYLNGTLLLTAGVAIVRVHNRWVRGWPILVTLLGWFAILGGCLRMFFPEAKQGGDDLPTYCLIAGLFATGALLSFFGYRRSDA